MVPMPALHLLVIHFNILQLDFWTTTMGVSRLHPTYLHHPPYEGCVRVRERQSLK